MLCKAGGGVQVGVPSYGPCEEAEETGRGVAWPTTVRSQVVAGRYPSRGRAWVRMEGPAPTHSACRVPWGLKDPPPGTSSRGSVADLRLVTHPHTPRATHATPHATPRTTPRATPPILSLHCRWTRSRPASACTSRACISTPTTPASTYKGGTTCSARGMWTSTWREGRDTRRRAFAS